MKATVFDPLRKKRVALTPEEQVRQSLIRWLCTEKRYPETLMASEYTIVHNRRSYRCDLVVFSRTLQPWMIAECKAPGVSISRETVDQVIRYNLALRAKYLVLTNGTVTFACAWNETRQEYEPLTRFPDYE